MKSVGKFLGNYQPASYIWITDKSEAKKYTELKQVLWLMKYLTSPLEIKTCMNWKLSQMEQRTYKYSDKAA